MAIDERFIHALHIESLRRDDLPEEDGGHAIFQTSTIGALLDGAYDGDITFGELRRHGNLGLGTLDALDGEMIAVDGNFFRASIDGSVDRIDDATRTPFAVVTRFAPGPKTRLEDPSDQARVLATVEPLLDPEAACQAIRIDGRFELVRARSVPRQRRPYPPLVEVVETQRVFDLADVEGTIVGFRFPDYAQGMNVAGYHLHFVSADRRRGGHVLDFRARQASVQIDQTSDLHVELPAGIDLESPDRSDATRAAVARVEHDAGRS